MAAFAATLAQHTRAGFALMTCRANRRSRMSGFDSRPANRLLNSDNSTEASVRVLPCNCSASREALAYSAAGPGGAGLDDVVVFDLEGKLNNVPAGRIGGFGGVGGRFAHAGAVRVFVIVHQDGLTNFRIGVEVVRHGGRECGGPAREVILFRLTKKRNAAGSNEL